MERHVRLLRNPDPMEQNSKLAGDGDDGSITRLLASAFRQVQAPPSQRRVLSSRPEDMVPALDQQGPQVDITRLRDAQLRIAVSGLTASRPQAEVASDVATSLEALLVAQRQNIGKGRKLAHAVDLDQSLGLGVLGLGELLDETVEVLDLHRQRGDLLEHWAKCLHESRWQYLHTSLRKA